MTDEHIVQGVLQVRQGRAPRALYEGIQNDVMRNQSTCLPNSCLHGRGMLRMSHPRSLAGTMATHKLMDCRER
eukprot:4888735-Prorocentrum_lima.AAC.1